MPKRILIRKAKENQERIKILQFHFCECRGSERHKSLTAQIIRDNKTFNMRVCEKDKGKVISKKLNNMKILSDGKHSMQYSQQNTLSSKIALICL